MNVVAPLTFSSSLTQVPFSHAIVYEKITHNRRKKMISSVIKLVEVWQRFPMGDLTDKFAIRPSIKHYIRSWNISPVDSQ